MRIVVDAKIPFLKGILDPVAEVVYADPAQITRDLVKNADALIVRTRTRCDARLLEGSSVRFIATATIGYDHIDTAYCESNGIAWTNAEGCNSSSVQQYIASTLMALAHGRGFTLAGKTIGIVGVGNVGKKVERLCRALGMRVLKNDPPRARSEGPSEFVSLDTIVHEADILTFHVPLNMAGEDKTYHLGDRQFLNHLRSPQILINTSRGEVLETGSLTESLRARRIAGCVLDVWEQEPNIDRTLLEFVTLATPHIAGYSVDGKANGTAMSVRALSRHFNLGLDSWFPAHIPTPSQTVLNVECTGKKNEQILSELIIATYDVRSDDRRLRASPETFEHQRGAYPLRREFPVYSVTLDHATPETTSLVKEIGFTLVH